MKHINLISKFMLVLLYAPYFDRSLIWLIYIYISKFPCELANRMNSLMRINAGHPRFHHPTPKLGIL